MMTGEQHEKLTLIVTRAFNIVDLTQLVSYRTTRQLADGIPKLPLQNAVFELLAELDRQGFLTTFLKAVIEVRPEVGEIQHGIPEIWPEVGDKPSLPRSGELNKAISAIGRDPAYKELLAKSQETLRSLYDSISLLKGYKILHDSLHHLETGVLTLLGASSREVDKDPTAVQIVKTCHETMKTQAALIDATILNLPVEPTSIRKWELDWASRLTHATNLALMACNFKSPVNGLQSAQALQRIFRQEPPRIDRYLRITTESVNLAELASLFRNAIALSDDEAKKNKFTEMRVAVDGLTVRLGVFVNQHTRWQDINAQLWDAENYLPRTSFNDTLDFTAFWKRLNTEMREMITTNPNAPLAAELYEGCETIDALLTAKEHDKIASQIGRLRTNAGFRFLSMDGELKDITDEIGKLGESIKTLILAS